MSDDSLTAEVAIVGFGPVGAILAALLGGRGVSVVVIDREQDVFSLPRAAHIDHTGLRTLQEIGCLDALLPAMIVNPGMDFVTADRKLLLRIPSTQPTPSSLPASMYFYQPTFDRTLRNRVGELPTVKVLLETNVVGVSADSDSVTLQVERRDGPGEIRAQWVVGCDGASSTVREAGQIKRDSFGFEEHWLIYDLVLSSPRPVLPDMAVQVCDPERPRTELPMPGNRYRFEFMLLPGEDAALMSQAEVAFAKLIGAKVPSGSAEIERTATYTFQGLVAKTWRRGRVLLAGDAAHLMPPFLGQGMCSGIRDVTNLAWKLTRVIKHQAPDALLDTYQLEREPHVRAIIQAAVELGRIICTTDREEAAARDRKFLSDPAPPADRFRFKLPDLAPGPLVLKGGGELYVQPPEPVGGIRLDDLVGQRFLVLARNRTRLDSTATWWATEMGALVVTLEDLDDPEAALETWLAKRDADVVVVRPDRYVLGAGKALGPITSAARQWLTNSTPAMD